MGDSAILHYPSIWSPLDCSWPGKHKKQGVPGETLRIVKGPNIASRLTSTAIGRLFLLHGHEGPACQAEEQQFLCQGCVTPVCEKKGKRADQAGDAPSDADWRI